MLELLKYVSFILTVFALRLLAVLNLYCIVDTHFQILCFRVVDLLAEAYGRACIIGRIWSTSVEVTGKYLKNSNESHLEFGFVLYANNTLYRSC